MERMMYNTILGAKPMQRDGRSFYYSDYNFQGKKEYCDHRWPCCSGTMPQVAADYRINTYFRDPRAVYVNLYIPSTVKWKQGGAHVALTQKTEYPFDSVVQFKVETSKPVDFALNLRIPEWTKGATISVNGKRLLEVSSAGRFMAVERRWKNGDRVELEMPLGLRLQPIDAEHPKTVALMQGPLVLFPVGDSTPDATADQLLAAKKAGAQKWTAEGASGKIHFLPFTAIEDETYATYLRVK
jgi:DUF1680 family protein